MAIENSKKNLIRKKLEQLIGREVIVYIDRPKGSTHPKHNNIVYPVNYGYIKEIIANDFFERTSCGFRTSTCYNER